MNKMYQSPKPDAYETGNNVVFHHWMNAVTKKGKVLYTFPFKNVQPAKSFYQTIILKPNRTKVCIIYQKTKPEGIILPLNHCTLCDFTCYFYV
jgi:hypothetical protein